MATKTLRSGNGITAIEPVADDANADIALSEPYVAQVEIEGVAAILFHRWSNEAVEEKAKAAKSYIWRTAEGEIGIPGEYLRGAIVHAAKFRQDPRSPRKSAMDLFKAGVVALTEVAPIFSTQDLKQPAAEWDYLDARRVMVQRSAITRQRPAFLAGWRASFEVQVNLPEYISSRDLHATLINAGRLIGIGDFRPTYGRFQVVKFEVQA
jgi:hypothetical protein